MGTKSTIVAVIIFVFLILGKSTFYVLNEGRQAVITEFGKPVGSPVTKAGLHFKMPFIQEARYVDKRILTWDGLPNQIPTKDKKYIRVDTTARWKITDALKFIQAVRNENGAKARLDTILDSATRDVISNQNLVEAVRNSNSILDKINEQKELIEKLKAKGKPIIEEEITGEIEKINLGRESLSGKIAQSAAKELKEFGIELIDVQLRRISYEKSVESKVYERMTSERQRVAQKIRSIGKGEQAKIEGRLERDLREIESQAYKKAQVIKGHGEAKAARIYAMALGQDPKFFEFIKTMEVYNDSITGDTKFILSSESELFKYFRKLN